MRMPQRCLSGALPPPTLTSSHRGDHLRMKTYVYSIEILSLDVDVAKNIPCRVCRCRSIASQATAGIFNMPTSYQ